GSRTEGARGGGLSMIHRRDYSAGVGGAESSRGPTRRGFLASAGSLMALPALGRGAADDPPDRAPIGIADMSYSIHARADRGFVDPLKFLEFCHARGAAGVQVPIGAPDREAVRRLRDRVEQLGAYLEGSLRT